MVRITVGKVVTRQVGTCGENERYGSGLTHAQASVQTFMTSSVFDVAAVVAITLAVSTPCDTALLDTIWYLPLMTTWVRLAMAVHTKLHPRIGSQAHSYDKY
ncbi:hypothetical protein PAXRUDRAFT_824417 [Paxillus rubicundulus Ve08.2h10]|uniref:Uncharacterized protein n=1 Tax=Paxillus rubicundulus Ve08.2h10 TaxID=930991 RepID=A0A0D0E229_9AGAM|nr:hypothetical protein PAXRUDRAFT_824417 [Paxillus rubicundulus Ve08.2h10]